MHGLLHMGQQAQGGYERKASHVQGQSCAYMFVCSLITLTLTLTLTLNRRFRHLLSLQRCPVQLQSLPHQLPHQCAQPTPIQPVLINTMQQTISRFVSKVASSNEEPKAQQNEGPTAQQSTVTVPRKDLDQFISSQKTFISRVARMLKLDASQLREQLQSKIIHLDIMTTERQQYATQYNEMKLKYKVISMLITSD